MSKLESLVQMVNAETDGTFKASMLTEDVMKVDVENLEDFPILVTISGKQMLARMNLVQVSEIPEENRAELNEIFFRWNPELPLSAVSADSRWYFLYGELNVDSTHDSFLVELDAMVGNVQDVFAELTEYARANFDQAAVV